jgi:hypothetical protein
MLFPDKWISCYSEQRIEVVVAKWAEVDQLAAQNRLKIRRRQVSMLRGE